MADDIVKKSSENTDVCTRGEKDGLSVVLTYLYSDSKRRWVGVVVNIAVVFIVVFFLCLLEGMFSKIPFIFVRFAEVTNGETDVVLVGDANRFHLDEAMRRGDINAEVPNSIQYGVLDGSFIDQRVAASRNLRSQPLKGIAPRTFLPLSVANQRYSSISTPATLLVYDDHRESRIGIGRTWSKRKLNEFEAHVSKEILDILGVEAGKGNRVTLQLNLKRLLELFGLFDEDALRKKFKSYTLGALIQDLNGDVEIQLPFPIPDDVEIPEGGIEVPDGFEEGFEVPEVPMDTDLEDVDLPEIDPTELPLPSDLESVGEILDSPRRQLVSVGKNNTITLGPSLNNFQLPANELSRLLNSSMEILSSLEADVVVVEDIENPFGKWSNGIGNVIAMESGHFDSLFQAFSQNANDRMNISSLRSIACTFTWLDGLLSNASSSTASAVENSELYDLTDLQQCYAAAGEAKGLDLGVNFNEEFQVHRLANLIGAQYENRVEAYAGSITRMRQHLRAFTDAIGDAVGVDYPIRMRTPLMDSLEASSLLTSFLGQIFLTIFFSVVALSAVLIHALAAAEVDQKSFELGMLRSLGLRSRDMTGIVVGQGLRSALPGLIAGMLFAAAAMAVVNLFIAGITQIETHTVFSWSMVIYAIIVGLAVPFLSNLLPACKSLRASLKQSIDYARNLQSSVQVKTKLATDPQVNFIQVCLAVLLISYGAVFLYLVPFSFLEQKYDIFLALLNVLLLGMMFGSSVIVQLLQPLLQKLLLWAMLPPFKAVKDHKLRMLVQRHLFSHRHRNRGAEMMFTLGVVFVIFSGSLISTQIDGITTSVSTALGSEIVIANGLGARGLDEPFLQESLESLKAENRVAAFSFISERFFLKADIGHITGLPEQEKVPIYGVGDEFFSTLDHRLLFVDNTAAEYTTLSDLDAMLSEDSGYTASVYRGLDYREEFPSIRAQVAPAAEEENSTLSSDDDKVEAGRKIDISDHPGLLGPLHFAAATALRKSMSLETDIPAVLELQNLYHARCTLLLRKVPGFVFSGHELAAGIAPILINEKHLRFFLYSDWRVRNKQDASEFPLTTKERLFIKVAGEGTTWEENHDYILSHLRTIVDDDTMVLDAKSMVENSSVAQRGLSSFLIVVTIVADCLCFVMLWTAIRHNADENKWELSVLRSMGFTRSQVIRVYLYESMCLVLSCIILGTGVGLFVSFALSIQHQIITEGTLRIFFPYLSYSILLLLAISTALIAPSLIIFRMAMPPIAAVLRSND